MKSALFSQNDTDIFRVYSDALLKAFKEKADMDAVQYKKEDVLKNPQLFKDTRFIFSTWGMPVFTQEEIKEYFPSLECVFYAAGSVHYFARPFLNAGVKVFSAWGANAVPVAEYALSQIILANKGFFLTSRLMSSGNFPLAQEEKFNYPGNYGEYVGIIGAGMIGKLLIQMLKNYYLNIKVFDPFLPDEAAKELGVKKCSLEELFSTCQVISNHLANNEQTKGMLNGQLFEKMRPYSTFINTGRGAQVVENELSDFLSRRTDVTAILDVTMPEPPEKNHPFYNLSNCILTPHIAGSSGMEVARMAQFMLDEYTLYTENKPCRYEVSLKMLETMA